MILWGRGHWKELSPFLMRELSAVNVTSDSFTIFRLGRFMLENNYKTTKILFPSEQKRGV